MQQYKKQFIEFALARDVLKFGKFTLKSGRVSPYFFNAGLFSTGQDLAMLGEFYSSVILDNNIQFDVVLGPAYKGIPLASAVVMNLATQHNIIKPYCFNRKEAKEHGEGGNVVGAPLAGDILLVDDVITAGTAIRESVALISSYPAKLFGVVIALDRQERGLNNLSAIQEIESEYDCKVFSIINLDDLIEFIEHDLRYIEFIPQLNEYRQQYGVK